MNTRSVSFPLGIAHYQLKSWAPVTLILVSRPLGYTDRPRLEGELAALSGPVESHRHDPLGHGPSRPSLELSSSFLRPNHRDSNRHDRVAGFCRKGSAGPYGLERRVSQFYTICDKNQPLNTNIVEVTAVLVLTRTELGAPD